LHLSWQRSVWTFRQVLAVIFAGGGGQAGRLPGWSGLLKRPASAAMVSSSSASSLACWSAARWAWKLATSRSRWARGLVLVLGGLPAGLVACLPPAQRRGASDGDGAAVPGLGGEGGVHGEWPGARPETGAAGRRGWCMVSPG
jgi:hypothetical protein